MYVCLYDREDDVSVCLYDREDDVSVCMSV